MREAWLAGLMDGEGSIGIRIEHKPERPARPYYLVAAVQMSMTCKRSVMAAIDVLRELGVKGAAYTYVEKDPTKHLDAWALRVHRLVDIQLLAEAMLPHAVTKRAQWKLAHEYATSRLAGVSIDATGRVVRGGKSKAYTSREVEIARQLHVLNQRGPAAIKRNKEWERKIRQTAASA